MSPLENVWLASGTNSRIWLSKSLLRMNEIGVPWVSKIWLPLPAFVILIGELVDASVIEFANFYILLSSIWLF